MPPASGWRYNPVASTFHNDTKVRAWPEDARALALYLLTNEHRTQEGFYRLAKATIADEIQWQPERLEAALARVQRDGFARYDEVARIVLVRKALKYHAPHGPKSIKGAVNAIKRTKGSPALFADLLALADDYAPDLAAAIRAEYALPEGPYLQRDRSRKGITEQPASG